MKPIGIVWQLMLAALLSGCFQTQTVVPLTAAENIRRTTDGRIFVSGRPAVYEIILDAQGDYQKVAVTQPDGCSYYGGLAELQDWLFFVCNNSKSLSVKDFKFANAGRLMAYSLRDAQVVTVAQLTGFQLANGLDALPHENAILIADEDFLAHGGVSKFSLNFDSGIPAVTGFQPRWIGKEQAVYAANGVRVLNGDVYLTDIGFVKKVTLDAEGNPQRAQILYRSATVLDDLAPWCDGVLVADYLMGKLIYVPADGQPVQKSRGGLFSPSAVLPDASPLFDESVLLVTETFGVSPGKGNQLAAAKWTDLGINACQ